MKRIYLWIFLLLAAGNGLSQNNIVHWEYWIDDNYTSKVQNDVSPQSTFNLQTTVPCLSLTPGLHTFSARFKDSKGAWSSTVTSTFLKAASDALDNNAITAYEYWMDNDYNSKVHQDVSPQSTFNLQTTVSCSSLTPGLHTFSARFKDSKGAWSSTVTSTFYKAASDALDNNAITAYEYWFDDYANHVSKPANSQAVFNLTDEISLKDLPVGVHSFNIRVKDTYGRWSSTASQYVHKFASDVVNRNITAYEYWFNDDYAHKVRMDISPQQNFVLLDSVNCLSLTQKVNTLSYRFLDDSGLWSSTYTATFNQAITIQVNFAYTKSAIPGETPVVENSYPDYASVGFTLYNISKREDITDVAFQFPDIVLTQQVDMGDSISITAVSHSLTNSFKSIATTIVVGDSRIIPATFNIVQNGLIRSKYLNSENNANVGIVYDSIGNRLAQYDYINQTLTTGALPDGTYQLLSMSKNPLFNAIQSLSDFASTELVQNTHYILQTLEVKQGIITETTIPTIPKLDESQVVYTTNNTVFSVNKSLIALDNYVTLRSQIEFNANYQGKVSNLKLIVNIPDSCTFIDKSVMIGDSVFDGYTIQNNQLTVPMKTDSDIVHFCIVPKQGGNYAPEAFIEFTLNSKTIRQPIGVAYFQAEGLSIVAPNITAQKTITVRGIVPAKSLVKIYDNDTYIGQTTALANGNWSMPCDLVKPCSFSFHDIHAEVVTTNGQTLPTKTKEVVYDETRVNVSKVTMYNTAHKATSLNLQEYVTKFDFANPTTSQGFYYYWPLYPDFTYTIEFEKNDTTLVSNVNLDVLTSSGSTVTLPVIYDPSKGLWVAASKFNSNSLPTTVDAIYDRKYVQHYETQPGGKTAIEDIIRVFSQLYDNYKECGDIAGISFNYFARIKQIFKQDPVIPATLISGVSGNSTGICFGDAALRLKNFLESALSAGENDFSNMPEGESVKELLQLTHDATVKMLSGFCDCLLTYSSDFYYPYSMPVLDPSGFVYEAVPSNRLQGVTATIFHKTNEADESVLWDAAGYEQENPLTTNEYGEYAWDVPQDLWQVKYEKDGYETTYSKWLPVPPPQLNINIAMVNGVPPFVKEAKGYEEGIDITFSKFMLPATMTTDSISVTRNGEDVAGTISLLDVEENPSVPGESFVSKVRFVPATPFLMTDEVILTVDSMVLSYAGKNMTNDFVQKIQIRKEVKSLVATPVLNVAINGKGYIEVSAEPFDAAAGKTVTARSVSSVLATVTGTATLNADGKAKLQVTGELPGSAQIIISLDGTDLTATTTVNIAMQLAEPEQPEIEQVETPAASIPSGSTVTKNTTLSLSTATEGASIYYTDDGSAPSVSNGSEYTQPIVLTKDVTIKAIAVKEGMTDSKIGVFEYTVSSGTGIDSVNRSVILFVQNQTLFIRGLKPGEQYTIYSTLGNIVVQGKVTKDVEQQITLPYKGVYVISTPEVKAKVLVE